MTKLCELLLLLPVDHWMNLWSFNKNSLNEMTRWINSHFVLFVCLFFWTWRIKTKGLCRVITKFKKRKRITFVRWPKIAVCTLAPRYRRPNRMDVFVTTASCPVYQSGWTVSPWTVRASIGINTTLIAGPVKKILSKEPFLLITSVWLGLPFSS